MGTFLADFSLPVLPPPIPPQVVSPAKGGVKPLPFGSLPVSHCRRDYLSLILSLPDTDSPALFGLPANIEQSLQRAISSKVTHTHSVSHSLSFDQVLQAIFLALCTKYGIYTLPMMSPQVLSQLRVVARSEGSAERFDREVWSTELSPLLSLWKKLNQVRLATERQGKCGMCVPYVDQSVCHGWILH